MQQSENQRLKFLIKELNLTQKVFAHRLGIQPGSLSDILRAKGGMGISTSVKYKLKESLFVNLDWLETGEGDPFLENGPLVTDDTGVPYYNINLVENQAADLSLMEEKPDYFVNYKPFNDCTAYLPVYGDSMYPRYAAGDVIAVKEVKNKSIILWGEAYVVITNENANELKAIKIIHEHADQKKVILRSSNPNYKGDIIIQKQDILSLYIIKGKITRNII